MNEKEEQVILVDAADQPIGAAGKMEAHREGALHRAFSVFAVNPRGEILLQRRAQGKYHGGGLWSNSCCGHPRPGEATLAAAGRRLREELRVHAELEPVFVFTYRAEMEGGLIEHEIDHVFVGEIDQDPDPDPAEVSEWRWVSPREIRAELRSSPDSFTPWFRAAFEGFEQRPRRARTLRN